MNIDLYKPGDVASVLGLPSDLIVEFVNDFINMANESKNYMYLSLKVKGELKEIYPLVNKLNGVAKNLHIKDAEEILSLIDSSTDTAFMHEQLEQFYLLINLLEDRFSNITDNSKEIIKEEPLALPFEEEKSVKLNIAKKSNEKGDWDIYEIFLYKSINSFSHTDVKKAILLAQEFLAQEFKSRYDLSVLIILARLYKKEHNIEESIKIYENGFSMMIQYKNEQSNELIVIAELISLYISNDNIKKAQELEVKYKRHIDTYQDLEKNILYLKKLVGVYKKNKYINKAIVLNIEILEIIKKQFLANPIDYEIKFINQLKIVGKLYRDNNQIQKAIPYYEDIVPFYENLYKKGSNESLEDYLNVLNFLSDIYYIKKQFFEAISISEKALQITTKLYEDHYIKWGSLHKLTLLTLVKAYMAYNLPLEAKELKEEASDIIL